MSLVTHSNSWDKTQKPPTRLSWKHPPRFPELFFFIHFISDQCGFSPLMLTFDNSTGRPANLPPSPVSPPPPILAVFHKEERSKGEEKEEMGRRSRRECHLLNHLSLSFRWPPAQVMWVPTPRLGSTITRAKYITCNIDVLK